MNQEIPIPKSLQYDPSQKSSWIAFIGRPNVGKSTLVNNLVGEKISITTPKAQTTRNSIKGIRIENDTQFVFIDTPGMFDAKTRMEKIMVDSAWQKIEEVDEVCLIIDAKNPLDDKTLKIIKLLNKRNARCNLLINKIDLIPKAQLLDIASKLSELHDFKNLFMISALKSKGIDDLLKHFLKSSKYRPWLFPKDSISSAPLYFMACEIVREKILFNTHEEIPYNIHIEKESWEEKENSTIINLKIMVKNLSHKKILIGKQGSLLKKIGTQARYDIEALLGKKVYLSLFIKVTQWEKYINETNMPQW